MLEADSEFHSEPPVWGRQTTIFQGIGPKIGCRANLVPGC